MDTAIERISGLVKEPELSWDAEIPEPVSMGIIASRGFGMKQKLKTYQKTAKVESTVIQEQRHRK